MTKDNSAFEFPLPLPDAAENHIYRCISLLIGRGRKYSVADVAFSTGIPERTVASWIATEDRRQPKAGPLLVLCGFLGPDFTSKLIGQVGQVAQHIDNAGSRRPNEIVRDVLSSLAVIGEAASDGRIDHTEAPACREAADRIIAAVVSLSSVGQPA